MEPHSIKPMCFVAMPFGKKAPVGSDTPLIDFDAIYGSIEKAVTDAGLDCIRADFESAGGFIHRPMYERLLVAEYVIADLTLANPNVAYEVGVRHGSRAKATLLICAGDFVDQLPFDFKPLRVTNYALKPDGTMDAASANDLIRAIGRQLRLALDGDLPVDNPILQVTATDPSGRIQHEKTDVFLKRIRYAGDLGERIADAIAGTDRDAAIAELVAIETEVLAGPQVVAQLHTSLISLYLGFREHKAYARMTALYDHLPQELQSTPVAIEQLALALNRLAETAADDGDTDKAAQLRKKAIRRLKGLDDDKWTSETYGIAGRIHKGQADAERKAGADKAAEGALGRAINTYEQGFRLDPRDYYPGVNAVTLRLMRGRPEDLKALVTLVPVVRFSLDRAPEPEQEMERYWQTATALELASAQRDWEAVPAIVEEILGIDAADWMRETTIKNLKMHQQVFAEDSTAVETLKTVIDDLQP